jgi:hypothetical protein
MNARKFLIPIAIVAAVVSALPSHGAVYTWVDGNGYAHFSDRAPAPAISAESQQVASKSHSSKNRSYDSNPRAGLTKLIPSYNAPGIPSPTTSSKYLGTDSSGFVLKVNRLAQYKVIFEAKDTLPDDAVLVVHYENPSSKTEALVDNVRRHNASKKFRSESSLFPSLKCGMYSIDVEIYSDSKKEHLLEVFRHQVRSNIDIDKPENEAELVEAILKGNCHRQQAAPRH